MPDPEPTLALRLSGARHAYPTALGLGRREVLHGIDLELARGGSLGLVGPNGSGKSTLLRVLAGVERASGGVVEVLGGSPLEARVRRRVGFLPEDSPFPRELRAMAALELLGTLHHMTRRSARERGMELLERVGLAGSARVALARYSRGMLRRFGIAQALLHEPDLLLLDEPTAGLDAEGYGALEDLVAEARARGAALVVSSHLLTDVHAHCERMAVVFDGRIAAEGPPAEVARGELGRVAVEVEGLDPRSLGALARDVAGRGGRLVGVQPAQAALLELYRRLERERRQRP